jgi:hypothetical protein
MKTVSKLVIAFMITAGLLFVYSKEANAQSIEQNATVTQNCTTGAYGQNNCYTTVTNNATQVTTPVVNRTGRVHTVENTGLDQNTMIAAVATLVTTAGGAIVTLKSKLAR